MSNHGEGSGSRRRFLQQAAIGAAALGGPAGGGLVRPAHASGPFIGSNERPVIEYGIQIGDVQADRAVIWSRSDRPARMLVEWSTTSSFARAQRVRGPHALDVTGLTARVDLTELPSDQDVFVRVRFQNLDGKRVEGERVLGHFRSAPRRRRDVRFLWTGDTAGQGWGINPAFGGMRLYKAMLAQDPDFLIHSGDTIYADGPMLDEVRLADGSVWKNAFLDKIPAKRKVAETLDEFRGNYLYNMCDEHVRAFNAQVPQVWQWDDHEVVNNWSDAKDLGADARYSEKRVETLVGRATRAFLEHAPMRWYAQEESERIYRRFPYGRDLEVFVVDMRSYRGPNTYNRQPTPSDETAFLGRAQIEWLKASLLESRATWKVIAADMPIGLLVPDGKDAQGRDRWEAISNGDHGPASGRELEIADLLRFLKRRRIRNVVWLTADVHYCAAHHYDPGRAQFQDFDPFWEFVAGPANAGSFGPSPLDGTFGPKVVFQKAPPAGPVNLPPSAGLQFFGQVDIDPRCKDMVVALKNLDGDTVFSQRLEAEGGPWSSGRDDD